LCIPSDEIIYFFIYGTNKFIVFFYFYIYINSLELSIVKRKKHFKDTKGVNMGHKSKEWQYNGQNKQDKGTNNDLQNTTQKTKAWATANPTKTGGHVRSPRRLSSSCSTSDTRRDILVTNPVDMVFHSLSFLSWFSWQRVVANKDATEPKVSTC